MDFLQSNRNLSGKKIVFVFGCLDLGGAERQGFLLARHLKERYGAEVQVAGLQGDQGKLAKLCESVQIPCHTLQMGQFLGKTECLVALMKFAKFLRRLRPDLLVSYTRNPNVFSGLAWRLSGVRSFVWNQADDGLNLSGELASRLAVALTPCFISNSQVGASFLQKRYGVPAEKIKIVHNGIALAQPVESRREWRERLGLKDDDFVTCMVANISRFKDHDTLLLAWQQLLFVSVPVKPVLLLAGRCDWQDGKLKCLLAKLQLGDRVRFLDDIDDIAGLLGACDMFVYSSRSEGLPNAVVEAMAAGLPVAGTDIPGIREAVGEVGECFLALPGDPVSLADKIVRLMRDPLLRQSYGEELRIRANSQFSLIRMLKCSTDCFSSLICEQGRDRLASEE